MTSTHREWDAGSYHAVSGPQQEWGRRVLDRLPLVGDEVVLDAGCGTGRVTRLVAERVPRGRVVAVDGSHAMVERARHELSDLADRVSVRQSDLLDLDLDERVDAAISTATFHWILDHERLFGRLAAALRPGGRLTFQCGGLGNIAGVMAAMAPVAAEEPYREHLAGFSKDWNFASAEATARRLAGAGFTQVSTWLEPAPVRLSLGGEAEEFLLTVVLRLHAEALPAELREPFAAASAARAAQDGVVTLDYVRLNADAVLRR
jgi:trans-aconitate 2-methyltransferase